jgi:hypothetical protein
MNRFTWRLQDDISWDGVSFYAFNREQGEALKAELNIVKHERGELIEPVLRLSRAEAQQLMNELWQIGFRPRDGAGSLAHVESQKAHLEDMRRLVFEK